MQALKEEVELQRDAKGLNEVFEDCAVLIDEREDDMMFPIETDVVI